MNTRNDLHSWVVAAAAAVPFSASARIPNPDNDSGTLFRCKDNDLAPPCWAGALPSIGQVSPDSQYYYIGGERGWVPRPQSCGVLVDTEDGLPHDRPTPVAAFVAPVQTGPSGGDDA